MALGKRLHREKRYGAIFMFKGLKMEKPVYTYTVWPR